MELQIKKFISIICINVEINGLEKIKNLVEYLDSNQIKYEIIISNRTNKDEDEIIKFVQNELKNTFYYSFAFEDPEKLASNAIDLSIGDLIFEFYNVFNIDKEFDTMFREYEKAKKDFTLYGESRILTDKLISLVASKIFKTRILTLLDYPRVSERDSLSSWNELKSKEKILKLALLCNNKQINYVFSEKAIKFSKKRHLRKSIRSIIYLSTLPLRFVTFTSLLGSFLSIIVSIYILFYSLTRSVVEGWTTTNLIISGSAFFIMSTLGIISEYLNQVISNSRSTGNIKITNEASSNVKSFKLDTNIEEI